MAYLHVGGNNVVDKRAEVDTVQALNWIVKDLNKDIINGSSKLVASDGTDKVVGRPRFSRGGVLCLEFLAMMGGGAGRYNRVQRRFGCWYIEWCSILCKVEGWVLEESQVALVVYPRAGDSHNVCGEIAEDQFKLLMCWFP